MLRKLAIALTTVAALVVAANLQAQGPGGGGRGRGMGMMGGGGMLMLLQNEQVQKDIELVADQKEKLQKLAAATRETMQSKMGDTEKLSREERMTKMMEVGKELQTEAQKKIEGILLPHQLERIKQIQLQSMLATMPGAALASPEVVKDLGLTDDQQAKVKALNEEARKAMADMFSGGRPSDADREKMDKARKERDAKFMDILTAEQKEKLEKMKGPKFDTSVLRQGPGGPGGRRGNGGGGNGGGGAGPIN
jgi:Spy/CpxP family protein refolding chaperone